MRPDKAYVVALCCRVNTHLLKLVIQRTYVVLHPLVEFSKVSSFGNYSFIRSCLVLNHSAEVVKKRTVKFLNRFVDQQLPTDVVQISFDELFPFVDCWRLN